MDDRPGCMISFDETFYVMAALQFSATAADQAGDKVNANAFRRILARLGEEAETMKGALREEMGLAPVVKR